MVSVVVRKKAHQLVAVATKRICKGSVLAELSCSVSDVQTRYTVQANADPELHLMVPEPFVRVQHSFDPNLCFHPDATNALLRIVALRDITVNETLTYDYNTTEERLAEPFKDNLTGRWVKGYGSSMEDPT